MAILRVILAILISLSVAALPATAGNLSFVKSDDVSAAQSTSSAEPAHDCDHHGSPHNKDSNAKGLCASMAACAIYCFNYLEPSPLSVALAPTVSVLFLTTASDLFKSKANGPLFRPPRV